MWFTEAEELSVVEAVENISQEDESNTEKKVLKWCFLVFTTHWLQAGFLTESILY